MPSAGNLIAPLLSFYAESDAWSRCGQRLRPRKVASDGAPSAVCCRWCQVGVSPSVAFVHRLLQLNRLQSRTLAASQRPHALPPNSSQTSLPTNQDFPTCLKNRRWPLSDTTIRPAEGAEPVAEERAKSALPSLLSFPSTNGWRTDPN